MSEWISCNEKLPDEGLDVLIFIDGNIYIAFNYIGECFVDQDEKAHFPLNFVSHWQPLPQPPAVERSGE